jgi:putative nucleotidyltransferase with HDIG domain
LEDKRKEIRGIIMNTKSLPTLPGIIIRLNALAGNDRTSIPEMARLVSSDQVLSARILKLANSPSYGFYRVSSISNAMILLGVNVVKSLAISSSIFEIMEKNSVGLWEHSLGAGLAANIIARRLGLQNCEEISTAALLHDIGKVIIRINFGDDYRKLLALIEEKDVSMLEAERDLLGTDHAQVGAWLAKNWFLPDRLVEPIACHHDVNASLEFPQKTSVVHFADVLVKASGFGFSGDELVPLIQPAAWDKLGMSVGLLEEIVEEFEGKLIDAKNFSLEIQTADEC